MKKIYLKPEIKIVDIKLTVLLDGSGDKTIPVDDEVIDNPDDVW